MGSAPGRAAREDAVAPELFLGGGSVDGTVDDRASLLGTDLSTP